MHFLNARNSTLIMALILNSLSACRNQKSDTPSLAKQPLSQGINSSDRTAELDKLIRDQNEALAKLTSDKSSLDAQAITLDNKIKTLTTQLTTGNNLTNTQKIELQKAIEDAEAAKAVLTKQIADLKSQNDLLQTQIDDTKIKANQLQKEIAATQGTTLPSSKVTAGTAGSSGTAGTPASPAVTGPFNSFRLVDLSKDLCLDLPSSNINDNAPLKFSLCNSNSQGQHFKVTDINEPRFNIKPRISSRCVAVPSSTDLKTIMQLNCVGFTNQLWEFYAVNGSEFKLRNNYSGNCMSVQADGSILQASCDLNASRFTWFDVN